MKILNNGLSFLLNPIASAITKVLVDFSPTAGSFISLGTNIVLETAYKLGISTVLPTASTTYALYGRASSATDYLKILSTGYLSLDVDGTVVTSTALSTKDLKFRQYSVELLGNDFIFKENDTVISTVTNAIAAAKTLTLNTVGSSNGADFYLGTLANAVMGSITFLINNLTGNSEVAGGVTATYQNIGTGRSFRQKYTLIDDDYFGTQAVVNSDFATDSEWSKGTNVTISGGQAVFASAPNNQGIVQNGVADEGRIFDVTITVSGYVEGGLQVRNPFEDFTPATADGVFTFTGIVDNNSVFLRAQGVTTLNIDSVTSRRRIEVAS
jgi:hypothetical protein